MTTISNMQLLVTVLSVIVTIVGIISGQMMWMYRALNAKIDGASKTLSSDIQGVSTRITDLTARVQAVEVTLMKPPTHLEPTSQK
jgi:hypothetical protein